MRATDHPEGLVAPLERLRRCRPARTVTDAASTADDGRMETAHGYEGPPPRIVGHGADPGPLTSATVVLRTAGAAGYGRHAAPPSAYGPADVHRLLPVPPIASGAPERADSGDDLGEAMDHAVQAEVVGTGDRSSDEESTKTTGFWARLRLLPKAA